MLEKSSGTIEMGVEFIRIVQKLLASNDNWTATNWVVRLHGNEFKAHPIAQQSLNIDTPK